MEFQEACEQKPIENIDYGFKNQFDDYDCGVFTLKFLDVLFCFRTKTLEEVLEQCKTVIDVSYHRKLLKQRSEYLKMDWDEKQKEEKGDTCVGGKKREKGEETLDTYSEEDGEEGEETLDNYSEENGETGMEKKEEDVENTFIVIKKAFPNSVKIVLTIRPGEPLGNRRGGAVLRFDFELEQG